MHGRPAEKPFEAKLPPSVMGAENALSPILFKRRETARKMRARPRGRPESTTLSSQFERGGHTPPGTPAPRGRAILRAVRLRHRAVVQRLVEDGLLDASLPRDLAQGATACRRFLDDLRGRVVPDV